MDEAGDPTAFGKDLSRAPALGSEASKIALMHADRLACVPEVATILKLLDNTNLVRHNGLLLSSPDWPAEWQLEAAERHFALASGCTDDADLVLQVMAVWERCDPNGIPSWEPSAHRAEWARRWWVNHDLLLRAAEARHEVLIALSPAMKEDVKRFVEPALVKRARGAITRAYASLQYRREAEGTYLSVSADGSAAVAGVIDNSTLFPDAAPRIIPLKRNKQDGKDHAYLSNIVTFEEWASPPERTAGHLGKTNGALDLLLKASRSAQPEPDRSVLAQLQTLWPAGLRVRLNVVTRDGYGVVEGDPVGSVLPSKLPDMAGEEVLEDPGQGLAQAEPIDLAEADANPELDTSWPTPVDPELDEFELEQELQLAFIADHADFLAACRECEACRSGRLADCESPMAPGSAERVTNDLETWLNLAWRNQAVAHPRVELVATETVPHDWYEVVGYSVNDTTPTIQVRPAWRQDDQEDRPGIHVDLTDGSSVQPEVGPERAGHRGAQYRLFYRTASGRRVGRFALRVASPSEALARHTVVEGVVARRAIGDTSTLTFVPNDRQLGLRLDLPRLSLEEAAAKYPVDGAVLMIVTSVHDNGGSAWLETADGTEGRVVKADVGASGVGDLRAAMVEGDEVHGIVREVREHNGKVQLQVALPDISGPTVEDAQAKYPPGANVKMRVTGIAQDGGRAWLVTDDGFGAMALRKDAGEAGIANLQDALVRGESIEARVLSVGEYNGKIQISVALPTLLGTSLAEAAQQLHAPGTTAQYTVTGITADGKRAFLKSPMGVAATLMSNRVGRGGVLALSTVLSKGQTVEATVHRVGEHRGEPQIELSMPDLEVPSVPLQLQSLRVMPGEVHDGVISNVTDFGVFVAVGPVSGLVHKSKLPGFSPSAYSKGVPLRVVIQAAGEDATKPGTAKIELAPA